MGVCLAISASVNIQDPEAGVEVGTVPASEAEGREHAASAPYARACILPVRGVAPEAGAFRICQRASLSVAGAAADSRKPARPALACTILRISCLILRERSAGHEARIGVR